MSTTTDDTTGTSGSSGSSAGGGRGLLTALAWLWVGIPFVYGVIMLVLKLPALF